MDLTCPDICFADICLRTNGLRLGLEGICLWQMPRGNTFISLHGIYTLGNTCDQQTQRRREELHVSAETEFNSCFCSTNQTTIALLVNGEGLGT